MRVRFAHSTALALALCGAIAHAGEGPSPCISLSDMEKQVKESNGSRHMIELTHDQWEFLRGIYAMNPTTPPGLPPGDRAVLLEADGEPDASRVMFVDGDQMCYPMGAPKKLVDMLYDIGSGAVTHEGKET